MVPAAFVQLDEMPLTPNGKVNRKALPKPSFESQLQRKQYLSPSNPIEKELVEIWQTALRQDSISVTDNFFDLGGHSLLAIKIFSQIEKRLGAVLPLATIFQTPTIQALAERLTNKAETKSLTERVLIPIQPEGDGEPIFFIHDGAGYIFQYEPLAKVVGKNRPVYGLIPPDWDGQKRPISSISTMADDYIKVIKAVQPSGPYHLSGFSIGGVLAYEIACKLKAMGDSMGTLALIEPTPWNEDYLIKRATHVHANGNGSTNGATKSQAQAPSTPENGRFRRHLTNLSKLAGSPKELMIYLGDSLYGRGFRIYEAISMPIYKSRIKKSKSAVPPNLRDYYYIHMVSLELLADYTPSTFDGELHLFMIDRGPLIDPAIGWNAHNSGETHVHVINTNEHSKLMRQPNVNRVAEILNAQIV